MAEVAAHIAGWRRFSAHRLERHAAGELLDPPEAAAFSAEAREGVAGRDDHELHAEAEDARGAFPAAVAALSVDALEAHHGLGEFIVEANGAHHYQEHLADFAVRDR